MKKHISKVIMLSFIALSFSFAASAQFYVRIRPAYTVVVERPSPPSPRHVWVEDEWVWRDGRYEHEDGYWAEPGPGYHEWAPGHWRKHRGRGWAWAHGHWK